MLYRYRREPGSLWLRSLFDRAKWTQEPLSAPRNTSQKLGFQNFDLRYNLGGEERKYDVKVGVRKNFATIGCTCNLIRLNQSNDQLWEALQPSIRLASRVIRSNHPHWRMLLAGIYHMRKVPREKDGRTNQQKEQPNYREYRSLWLDIDRDKMYPSARRLYDLQFEAARATLGILTSEGSMSI